MKKNTATLAASALVTTLVACGTAESSPATTAAPTSLKSTSSGPDRAKDESKEAAIPEEGKAALQSAQQYIDFSGFSEKGLRSQLKFEKFPSKAIDYAMKNVDADYNAEAVETAESYLDMGGMSKAGLRSQLAFEGYSKAQINHAMKNAS